MERIHLNSLIVKYNFDSRISVNFKQRGNITQQFISIKEIKYVFDETY